MADEPTTGAAETEAQPSTESTEGTAETVASEVEKWKALARQNEKQAKANADAARRLAEIEESQKTETQKLTDKLAATTEQVGSLTVENARLRVALRHGLTEDQARRLIGGTEEELDEDAEKLKESLGLLSTEESTSTPALPQRPREQLRSGSQPAIPIGDDDALTAALKKKLGVG